ncbi:MAG: RDD family protein [Streptosporangiales bacterium]
MTDVTQPPEDQQWQQPPVPQPFTMPSPPPAGDPGPPAGAAPGQAYGAYQAHPGSSYGTPGGGTPGQPAPSYGTGGRLARDPALAEWWQRLLARLVDDVILIILTSPVWILGLLPLFRRIQRLASQYPDLSQPAAAQAFNDGVNQLIAGMVGTFLLIGAGIGVVSFGYDWLQHGLWGQTIGKRVMGTKVVTADTRSPISGQAACGRAAVYALVPVVPSVGGLFALINESWLLWDPRRQCLHDKAAGTVVVKKSALAPGGPQPNRSV